WMVDKLVPDLGITAVSGVPGSYKSWLSVYIAKCVNEGLSVLGKFETNPASVLVVDLENPIRVIRDRLTLLGFSKKNKTYYWKGSFAVDDDDDFGKLKSSIEAKKIRLVIFDSLVRMHNGDENDSRSMSAVFKRLKELADLKASVVFIHHSRKQSFSNRGGAGETMRGSSDILAAIDSHLLLEKTKDGIKVTQSKLRQDEPVKPFNLKVVGGGDKFEFEYAGEAEEPLDKLTQAREELVKLLSEKELTRQEAIESLKETCGAVIVDKSLKGLMAEKVVDRRVGARNTHTYYLVKDREEEQVSLIV
ncbi:AAA family ATPase, partial [Patescibacteria group bacterium]